MNTLQDRTISKSLFYITNNNNKAHFLICGKHKQLVNKNTWEECSHIKTETAKIFKTNKNIKKFMLEFDIPEGSLFKTFTNLNTYNTITEIDNTKYYDFNIIKECNNSLQELIKKQIIKKPTFEKT